MPPRLRNPLPPLLAIASAILSAGLIVWAARQRPSAPGPAVPATAEPTPAPTAPPPQEEPVAEPTGTPAPPPPPSAAAEPSPVISADELPLPTSSPGEPAGPSPLLSPLLAIPGDLPALAGLPRYWPAKVKLLAPARFPVFLNGVEAGTIQVPAGALVTLRKLRADGQAEVERQGAFATLPATATDVLARAQALAAAVTPAPSAATASPAPEKRKAPPPLQIVVTRSRQTGAGAARARWSFKVRLSNPSSEPAAAAAGRFFAFSRKPGEPLLLAANEPLTAPALEPGGTATLEPPALKLDAPLDGYAVLLRDAQGAVVGSLSTRESATADWAALEAARPGSPLATPAP